MSTTTPTYIKDWTRKTGPVTVTPSDRPFLGMLIRLTLAGQR